MGRKREMSDVEYREMSDVEYHESGKAHDDMYDALMAARAETERLQADIDRLVEALKSARGQTYEQTKRASLAEARCRELENANVHPVFTIDLQEHRNESYQMGWSDGYAEGFAKARNERVDP